MPVSLRQISPDTADLAPLRKEAAREGFRFLERLVDDWAAERNRFDASGEKLIGAFVGDQLVGIAGLNHEPYERAPGRARLRHLYVLNAFRRRGVGSILVRHLLEEGRQEFNEVHLRTETAEAVAFYENLGFNPVRLSTATHVRTLRAENLRG